MAIRLVRFQPPHLVPLAWFVPLSQPGALLFPHKKGYANPMNISGILAAIGVLLLVLALLSVLGVLLVGSAGPLAIVGIVCLLLAGVSMFVVRRGNGTFL